MADLKPLGDIVVNDRFWLGWAREQIGGNLDRLDNAAGRLTVAIGWFWTVYTAVSIVGVTLRDLEFDIWQTILIFSPTVLLVIAYLSATWAALPVKRSFDPRIPSEILEIGFLRGVQEKQKRLIISGALTLAATALVVAGGATIAISEMSGESGVFRVVSTGVEMNGANTTLSIGYAGDNGQSGVWRRPAILEMSLACWTEAVVGEDLPECAKSTEVEGAMLDSRIR